MTLVGGKQQIIVASYDSKHCAVYKHHCMQNKIEQFSKVASLKYCTLQHYMHYRSQPHRGIYVYHTKCNPEESNLPLHNHSLKDTARQRRTDVM